MNKIAFLTLASAILGSVFAQQVSSAPENAELSPSYSDYDNEMVYRQYHAPGRNLFVRGYPRLQYQNNEVSFTVIYRGGAK